MPEMPMTPVGKIFKPRLREITAEAAGLDALAAALPGVACTVIASHNERGLTLSVRVPATDFFIKSGKTNARPDIPEHEWKRLTNYLTQDKRRLRESFPYSLRHTYSTMRLSKGVSIFSWLPTCALRRLLDRFYGKKRMRDPKMASEVAR